MPEQLIENEEQLLDTIREARGKFAIYGCGRFGLSIMGWLASRNIPPVCVCDGNPDRYGEDFQGSTIISPGDAVRKFGPSVHVIVAVYGEHGGEKHGRIRRNIENAGSFRVSFLSNSFYGHLRLVMEGSASQRPNGIFEFRRGLTLRNGALSVLDQRTDDCVIVNGERRTCHVPDQYAHTLFVIGSSVALSTGMSDDCTLPSFLQNCLNQDSPSGQSAYRVRNFGSTTPFPEHIALQAAAVDIKPGDIVLVVVHCRTAVNDLCRALIATHRYCREKGGHCIVALMSFPQMFRTFPPALQSMLRARMDSGAGQENRRTYEENRAVFLAGHAKGMSILHAAGCPAVSPLAGLESMEEQGTPAFIDLSHLSAAGNKLVAEQISRDIISPVQDFLSIQPQPCLSAGMKKVQNIIHAKYKAGEMPAVRQWLQSVRRADAKPGLRAGALIMNCNPFTKGHLHIAETAADQVDVLYVFVVEADRSEYSFADRFRMVEDGLRDLGNVILNPSGDFILSSMTFEEYFGKATRIETVDPSLDIAIFGAIIGPGLGIAVRFVGEEPLCAVTRQYNETMLRMLPPMGIEVKVIPRLCHGPEPVSASRVRELIRDGDWEKVRAIVPDSSYERLMALSREGK